MCATICAGFECIGQVRFNQLRGGTNWCTNNHLDPLFGEEVLSSLAHATGNNESGILFRQPAWQDAWLMGGRGEIIRGDYLAVCGIGYDQGELLAMAKVLA
jgi:hypothetical protein